MAKLKKIAKGLEVFLRISFWFLSGICAVIVAYDAVLLIGGEQVNNLGEWVISYNGVSLNGVDISGIDFTQAFTMMAILFVFACSFILYGLRVVIKMLQPMKEGQPFDTAVSRSFKKLGWLSLIYGVAGIIVGVISQHLVLSALAEAAIQAGGTLSVQHRYDGGFILVAV